MKKAIILGLLLSSTLLVECSNSKKTTEVSKESKIEKSSSKKEETQKSSTTSQETASTDQTVPESSSQSTTQSQSAAEPSVTERDIDASAIFNGDISSVVGKWENVKGDYIILNNDYTVIHSGGENSPSTFKLYEADYKKFVANPGFVVPSVAGGYAIMLFPIGHPNLMEDQSNINRPRLIWGNSPSEDFYYRK